MEFIKQYQTLVSASVALLASLIAFIGVIYSQYRVARIAEIGRAHQEKMAKEQGERSKNSERNSFQNAVLGELSALQTAIANAMRILVAQISIAEEMAKQNLGKRTQPRISFRFVTPVFDSHVARIGILTPELSFKVTNLYGQIKALATNAQDQVPEMDASMAGQVMTSVKTSLVKLDMEIQELQTLLNETSTK
jgi:hypothetical protein